jgi:hypothetical protein
MPCRPRTASLRAGSRCLIELRSICSEASDRRSGASRDASNASIGSKESIRGPVCVHSPAEACQRLPETAQRLENARKCQQTPRHHHNSANSHPSGALSLTQLSHSLQPNHRRPQHNIKIFIRSLAQHFGIPASHTALSDLTGCLFLDSGGGTYLSLLTRSSTTPCPAGLRPRGYSTVHDMHSFWSQDQRLCT